MSGVFRLMLQLAVVSVVGLTVGAPAIGWSAENDAPPAIKHAVADPAGCLQCHGPSGVKSLPSDHTGRGAGTCVACHHPAEGNAAAGSKPPESSAQKPASPPADQKSPDATCLVCHSQQGATLKLQSGEQVSVYVDTGALAQSVHGNKLGCTACHKDKAGYPHAKVETTTLRAYVAGSTAICASCHQSAAAAYSGSVHGKQVAEGNSGGAMCVDCHSSHAVRAATQVAVDYSSCRQCHNSVIDSYSTSVHGKLVISGNRDAATCVDCHTSSGTTHQLQRGTDSGSVSAPQNVPQTCGKCHQKALQSYSSTFHGKAMRLGVTHSAATCVDCHGTYGVQRVHGPEAPLGTVVIAQACAKCHQGADESFASGWLGHEEPSPQWFPVVFVTERFLFFLMTSVVAFGIVHVEFDLLRSFVNSRKRKDGKGGKDDGRSE